MKKNEFIRDVKHELPAKEEIDRNEHSFFTHGNESAAYNNDESNELVRELESDKDLSQLFSKINLASNSEPDVVVPMEVSIIEERGQKRSVLDASSLADTTIPIPKRKNIDMSHLGPLSSMFYRDLLYERDNDVSYGPHVDGETLKLGQKNLTLGKNDEIQIADKIWKGTPGLFQLIFKKNPKNYTHQDLAFYSEILDFTGSHLNSARKIKSNAGFKYTQIIGPLYKSKKGGKLNMNFNSKKMEYVYYDSYDELIDRLRLLVADKEAGNTSHDNEILSIVEELEEGKIIKRTRHGFSAAF